MKNEFQEPLELESEYVLRYWKHIKNELSVHHAIEDSDLEKIEKALDLNEYTLISIQV